MDKDVRVTSQRERDKELAAYFETKNKVTYCTDIDGLFEELGHYHNASDWRLFIDASNKSLKAVLLHNGNELPPIPMAYTKKWKESYDSLKLILDLLQQKRHKWLLIGDFKIVAFGFGLQQGYTKFPCFLCLWDSRAFDKHYIVKEWPARTQFVPGQHNIKQGQDRLFDAKDVLMPPLHLKLGLCKQFVKRLLKTNTPAFNYLKEKFPGLSEAKIKGGIFVGPQIRKLMSDVDFDKLLTKDELMAWNSFKAVVNGFLGNNRAENYKELVEKMVSDYGKMGCNMSLKLHIMDSHLDHFKDNMGAYSEEHGERFHQDISSFEKRYQGKEGPNMLADFLWFLKRESGVEFKRQRKGMPTFPSKA